MPHDSASPASTTSIASAPWLGAAALQRVFDALDDDGQTLRIVGGAVRNTLLGVAVHDVDLATTLSPETVMARATVANLTPLPTGLKHGTVTIISAGQSFEVTTLRRDVESDGRHARVAFTTCWSDDARRRDFTMNALYADRRGAVFDPLADGLDDLAARRVRFIGDAGARIAEDYLRILRFFRFAAIYGDGHLDPIGLAAAAAARDRLTSLSAERVWSELAKLLAAPALSTVIEPMASHGILAALFPVPVDAARLQRFISIDAATSPVASVLGRLAALACRNADDAMTIAHALRLSARERDRLVKTTAAAATLLDNDSALADKTLLYRMGAEIYCDAVRLAWSTRRADADDASWRNRIALVERWHAPALPVSGGDFVARGVSPGPAVGRSLERFEREWIAADFPLDSETIAKMLAQAIERS